MKRSMIAGIAVAASAMIGIGVGSYASPYLTLHRLSKAAEARDAATINEYVDFPALRESLKQQLSQSLKHKFTAEFDRHPFNAFGTVIMMALVTPLVEAYATPDGIAAILAGIPPRGQLPAASSPPPPFPPPNRAAPGTSDSVPSGEASSSAQAAPPSPADHRQTTAHYHDLNQFVVIYRRTPTDKPYAVIFRRDGLFSWRLAGVDLAPVQS